MHAAKTINGVDLPANVVQQLEMLGLELAWYTKHELESSVRSCAVDNKLVDDPNGINFADKIELTHEEKTFRERLEQERENAVSENGVQATSNS